MKVFAALQLSKGFAIPIQKLGPLHVAEQVVNGGWYDLHGGSQAPPGDETQRGSLWGG